MGRCARSSYLAVNSESARRRLRITTIPLCWAGQCSWYEFALEIQRQAMALKLLDKAVPISAIDSLSYAEKRLRKAINWLQGLVTAR